MNILRWFIQNWDDIMLVVVLIIVLINASINIIRKVIGMTDEERIAYVKRLLQNLMPIAVSLVTKAEMRHGGNSGFIKRAEVFDELYSRIPDEFKPYVTEHNINLILEQALDHAKEQWEGSENTHLRIQLGLMDSKKKNSAGFMRDTYKEEETV